MSCEELREYYELFAMGVADEPEGSEIRNHLGRGCAVCTAEMKRAMAITACLSNLAPAAAPSPKLRKRILASVGVEQRTFGWAPFLAAATALALVAAFYFARREQEFVAQSARLRDQLRTQTIELTRMNEALSILNGAETKMVSFGAGQPQPPNGKVFFNPAKGVLLVASNLPPAPRGKTYEMWVVPKGGSPARAGEFQSGSDGTAIHVRPGALDPAAVGAFAVTMENEGGADTPTMPILIVAPLQ